MGEAVDVIIACDQLDFGVITHGARRMLKRMGQKGKTVVVHSRQRIGDFRNVIIKPNEMEAVMASRLNEAIQGSVEGMDLNTLESVAKKLYKNNNAPVIITRGDKGAMWYSGEKIYLADSIPVNQPIDIVGAGDAFLAAFSCAYSCGFSGPEAIAFGNLVSSVVIRKIGMAGTASPDEIISQVK